MQFYSNRERESDTYALPDCETLYYSARACREYAEYHPGDSLDPGWYYWYCLPGCLPDSDPTGPFDTEREAIESAQSEAA